MADRRPKNRAGSKPIASKTPRPRKKPANVKKAARAKTARAKAAKAAKAAKMRAPGSTAGGSVRKGRSSPTLDPSASPQAETRHVQPYQATKSYLCPGCNQEIPAGMGHLVAVPPEAPDLRRHWHRGCWNNRHNLG